MPDNTLSILKINLLKHYLTSNKIDVEAINTAGELWCSLFSHQNCLEWYDELKNAGIFPTQEELAEYRKTDDTNVWYRLAGTDARIPIFQDLLDKGIIPLAIDLSHCHARNNDNTWYWLARSDARIPIFQALLDKGVIPQATDLSPCYTKHN
ncbi:MAG: hypothetical protein K0S11_1488, partial [Gammaproteobacteria bacterium]|nr:hypothetical protein [Gammaproteobacteria bacterium]